MTPTCCVLAPAGAFPAGTAVTTAHLGSSSPAAAHSGQCTWCLSPAITYCESDKVLLCKSCDVRLHTSGLVSVVMAKRHGAARDVRPLLACSCGRAWAGLSVVESGFSLCGHRARTPLPVLGVPSARPAGSFRVATLAALASPSRPGTDSLPTSLFGSQTGCISPPPAHPLPVLLRAGRRPALSGLRQRLLLRAVPRRDRCCCTDTRRV